ncbi:beta-ketoacyl-ACP synthase 3 [Alicyclobacillus curvatus]|nr:beta-ketoacyl-ACP synthase 3 [Alicyclobacillus curvatus]
MAQVGILGIGVNIPDRVVTNAEIALRFGISEEEIVRKTGILARRYERPEATLTDMSSVAALHAIADAGLSPKDIDLIIISTNTHDRYITAALVQDRIGGKHCAGLDLHSGCSSFITGFATGAQFVQTGLYKYALVVAVDKCSSLLNPMDRKTALLFADGAAAVVLGPVSSDKGILAIYMGMDGAGGKYLHLDEDGRIYMDGRAVFDFATQRFPSAVHTVLSMANLGLDDLDYLIPHQSNLRIIEEGVEKLGLPMERVATKVIQHYGNSSAAAVPLALFEALKDEKIKDGDTIVLAGYGAGLGWGE